MESTPNLDEFTKDDILAAVKYGFSLSRDLKSNVDKKAKEFVLELQKKRLMAMPVPCVVCGHNVQSNDPEKVYVQGFNTAHRRCADRAGLKITP